MAIIALKGLGKAFKKNTRGTPYKLEKAPAKHGQGKRALKAKERGLVPIKRGRSDGTLAPGAASVHHSLKAGKSLAKQC